MITKTTDQRNTSSRSELFETSSFIGRGRLDDHEHLNLLSQDQHLQSALYSVRENQKIGPSQRK